MARVVRKWPATLSGTPKKSRTMRETPWCVRCRARMFAELEEAA